jgi:hypothetical protein
MKSKFLIASVAGAALLGACKDDTAVYAGGTVGAPVALAITQSAFVFRQNDTGSIGAQLTDSAGNLASGAATITSCDPTIVAVTAGTAATGWAGLAAVKAVGVGHSCIITTSGSFADTTLVDVGPYALTINGPAAAKSGVGGSNDPNPGKVPYVYKVVATDSLGNVISAPYFRTWTTTGTQSTFAPTSKNGVADSATLISQGGTTSGTRVTVTAIGGATATFTVAVGDGDFTGTVTSSNNTATQTPGADSITLARNTGAVNAALTSPNWDANTNSGNANNNTVFVNGIQTFVKTAGGSTGVLQVLIPPTGQAAGTLVPVRILGIGSTDITQITSVANGNQFTVQNSTGDDAGTATNRSSATADTFKIPRIVGTANSPPPTTINITPTKLNYTILYGPCTGGPPTTGVAGTNCDDWLIIKNDSTSTRNVTLNLAWFSNADIDIYAYQADGTTAAVQKQGQTRQALSESLGITIPPDSADAGIGIPNANLVAGYTKHIIKVRANLFLQNGAANTGSSNNPAIVTCAAGATCRATLLKWTLTVNNN